MGALVASVDLDGKTVDEAVAGWMSENEATWSTWID